MYEECLEGVCALRDNRAGGIGVFEVVCDRVWVCEHDRMCLRERRRGGGGGRVNKVGVRNLNASGVEERGKGVDGLTVGANSGGWCVDGTHGFFDVWELDPASTIREALVVQDQPENRNNNNERIPRERRMGIGFTLFARH